MSTIEPTAADGQTSRPRCQSCGTQAVSRDRDDYCETCQETQLHVAAAEATVALELLDRVLDGVLGEAHPDDVRECVREAIERREATGLRSRRPLAELESEQHALAQTQHDGRMDAELNEARERWERGSR